MTDYLLRMPFFLQEYIYTKGWLEFREVQQRSFEVVFGTEHDVLISAGTSSGKTEAALFPVITALTEDRPSTIGALYIGPTKALIDDQFDRIRSVLRESKIPVTGWHGEVSRTVKKAVLDKSEGIVQITPESLQGILLNHQEDIPRLFSDLRFVIIDEVHTFMSSDRGYQLLCELDRIEKLSGCRPRRIGLSATISDFDTASEWLRAGSEKKVDVISCSSRNEHSLKVVFNRFPPDGEEQDRKKRILEFYRELFRETDDKNCIVFVNSRAVAEKTARSLGSISQFSGSRNKVFVHHGNISKEYRAKAEAALKGEEDVTVVATMTLELGMDIGSLDRVVQVGAPYTCSSLVQRMGRSGRRGGKQDMVVFCNEDDSIPVSGLSGVSLKLIRTIALIELFSKDGWIEPLKMGNLPFGLLFHQTLAYVASTREDSRFTDLVRDVLSQYAFRDISKDDYRELVRHMVQTEFLHMMEDRTLVLGHHGERIVWSRGFASVFKATEGIEVRSGEKILGSIQDMPEPGTLVQIAGKTWEVVSIGNGAVDVIPSEGHADTSWNAKSPDIDNRVLSMMRDVLLSDELYDYLDFAAEEELNRSREAFRAEGYDCSFIPIDDGYLCCPWLGTIQFDTMRRILERLECVRSVYANAPYCMWIRTDAEIRELNSQIQDYVVSYDLTSLIRPTEDMKRGKYDGYVPVPLLKKSYAADRFDSGFR